MSNHRHTQIPKCRSASFRKRHAHRNFHSPKATKRNCLTRDFRERPSRKNQTPALVNTRLSPTTTALIILTCPTHRPRKAPPRRTPRYYSQLNWHLKGGRYKKTPLHTNHTQLLTAIQKNKEELRIVLHPNTRSRTQTVSWTQAAWRIMAA